MLSSLLYQPSHTAKFSDDGKRLLTRGQGDVTIRLKWDDRPSIPRRC